MDETKTRLKKAIDYWLLPDEKGSIRGYGGKYPSFEGFDPYDSDCWSDEYDYQKAVLDIYKKVFKTRAGA